MDFGLRILERIRHLALGRRNSAGRHIATVIVVHDSGRLYPEAIILTTTAPYEVKHRGIRVSLHHFESEVGGARCLDRTCPPQFDSRRVEILEEPDTAAE